MSDKENAIAQYSTLSNYGLTEASLTWNRYAAFLVLEGFFLAGALHFMDPDKGYGFPLLGITACIGLLITMLWYLLNFYGWLNQNVFYYYASQVKIKGAKLPTDKYNYHLNGKKPLKALRPKSVIYIIAQLVLYLLMLVYSIMIIYGFSELKVPSWNLFGAGILILLISIALLQIIEKISLKRRVKTIET